MREWNVRSVVSTLVVLVAAGCGVEAAPPEPVGAGPSAVQAARDVASDWSVAITTAPHHPQDVWMAAHGNNTDGFHGGGSVCLGVLANFDGPGDPTPVFLPGDHATLQTTVVEAGLFGVDGAPVPPGDYVAPGNPVDESPARAFSLQPGESFYVVFDGYVVNTSEPAGFPAPAGTTVRFMFTFDHAGEGRQEAELALWVGIPSGDTFVYVPFLNEGAMMVNVRRQ